MLKENISKSKVNQRVAYYILLEALNHKNENIIYKVIGNRQLPVEFLKKIADDGITAMLEMLLENQIKLIAYPEIMEKIDFVLGYGGYFKRKGLLNKYIRYDSMTIALQYLGMAIRGVPYMGVGRNLAYKKSLFFERKGFGTFSHVVSGDDDLFVNSNADRNNTTAELRREAHTRSVPSASFGEWIKQKKRHMMTARYYNPGDKFRLVTEPITRILFYVSFIILLSNLFLWHYVLAIFGLRLIIQTIVISLTQKRLNERGIEVFSLFFDIFSPVINSAIYTSNIFTRPAKNTWK